jgi:hypothetical protein
MAAGWEYEGNGSWVKDGWRKWKAKGNKAKKNGIAKAEWI